MNRIDLALVAAVDQVLHHGIADLAVLGRSTDHRHRLGLHDAGHLLDDGRLTRPIARRRRIEIEHDAHVGRGRALLGGEYRIQVHFRNFGKVRDQRRDPFDHRRQRRAVHGLRSAHAAQDLSRLDAVQHRQGVFIGGGRQPEGDVLQHLDQNAAEAEGDQLAEGRIGHRADDDFLAAGQHLLNLHAENLGLGVVFLGVADDGVVSVLRRVRRLDADDDAARFGLVQNLRRDDFHDHRKADAGSELDRLLGVFRHALLGNGDSVGLADSPRLGRGQCLALGGLGLIQNLANGVLIVSGHQMTFFDLSAATSAAA